MTITRITQVGCEPGHINEFEGFFSYIEAGYSISASAAYTGNYGVRVFNSSITRSHVKLYIPATRQVRFGMFYKGTPSTSLSCIIINLNPQVTIGAGTNGMTLNVGGVVQGTIMMPPNMFHLGLDCKIDSSSGWVKLYTNGKERISMTGNTGNVNITEWQFGKITAGNFQCEIFGDDIYIDDTTGESMPTAPPPIRRFYYIKPNANGNYSNWDGSDGNKTDNYQLIDEVPPITTDFVETISGGISDSYGMTDFTPAAGQTIEALIPIAYAIRGATSEQLSLGTRYSSTDVVGSGQNLSSSYNFAWERQTTKPGGGAWDQTSVNGVEALIVSSGVF